jgi:glycosyltransferase involved in cell wall biosynthesis
MTSHTTRAKRPAGKLQPTRIMRPRPIRVLYSFPYRIGAGRICTTACQQVLGLDKAGAEVTVLSGSSACPMPEGVKLLHTLALGALRLPVSVMGRWHTCRMHDRITAAWLRRHGADYDVFHGWPLSSIRSLHAAKAVGIRTFIERPNAHTGFAYEVVAAENKRLGYSLPRNHDHAFNARHLALEEMEYATADHLMCPSDFVVATFEDRGYGNINPGKLLRHQYGFDDCRFKPADRSRDDGSRGLRLIYAGVGEPRKGLHHALAAWKESGAGNRGEFLICGEILPSYRKMLAPMLDQPGVVLLGHRNDLPELMARADAFVLPSLEEGSALVTYEARGSGCVLLVSDSTGAVCTHMVDSLVHKAGDHLELGRQMALLDHDRALLEKLRERSLADRNNLTWDAAGLRLLELYKQTLGRSRT